MMCHCTKFAPLPAVCTPSVIDRMFPLFFNEDCMQQLINVVSQCKLSGSERFGGPIVQLTQPPYFALTPDIFTG